MNNDPIRIQRKRTKDWRMPDNTIFVGRPTIYGNPFRVGIWGTAEECVAAYERYMSNEINQAITDWKNSLRDNPGFDRKYSPYWGFLLISGEVLEKLRGKNLACWCALENPCHADILLKLVNLGDTK